MRSPRRRLLMLEILDERIVPSMVGNAPMGHAGAAEHSSIQLSAHAKKMEALAEAKSVHHAHVIQHQAAVAMKIAKSSAVAHSSVQIGQTTASAGSPSASASPAIAVSVTGVGQAKAAAVATTVSAPSMTPAPAATVTSSPASGSTTAATSTDPGDIQNGPLANAGQDLITIYEEFEQGGGASLTSSKPGQVEVVGTNVGVDVHSIPGSFNNLVSTLSALGMQIKTESATYGIIEGLLPIAQLPTVAQNAQVSSVSPIYNPIMM